MRIYIVGDSQAQGAGATLAAKLKAQGHAVERDSKHGADSAKVLQLAQQRAGQPFDMVVVFSGSTAGGAPAAKGIPALWPSAKVIWYGSSPATKILDLKLAQKVFGPHVKTADHWQTSGEAAAREARNAQLPKLLPAGVQYVDWRRLSWPGGAFPAQADGIHVGKASAEVAFSAPNWPPPAAGLQLGQLALPAALVALAVWIAHRQGWLRGLW